MKTHKGFKKRFRVMGGPREKMFKHRSAGKSHLLRNKTKANKLRSKRLRILSAKGYIKKAKRLMPYYKQGKYIN